MNAKHIYTATRQGETPGIRFTATSDLSARKGAAKMLEEGCSPGQLITLVRRSDFGEAFAVWTKLPGKGWRPLTD